MSKEDDYRENAAETLELAHRAGNSADRGRLLALTEKWLDLADRTRRIAPLIRAKLDRRAGLE